MTDSMIVDMLGAQFGLSRVKATLATHRVKSLLSKLPAELRDSQAAQLWTTIYAVGGTELIEKTTTDFEEIAKGGAEVPVFLRNIITSFVSDGEAIRDALGV